MISIVIQCWLGYCFVELEAVTECDAFSRHLAVYILVCFLCLSHDPHSQLPCGKHTSLILIRSKKIKGLHLNKLSDNHTYLKTINIPITWLDCH